MAEHIHLLRPVGAALKPAPVLAPPVPDVAIQPPASLGGHSFSRISVFAPPVAQEAAGVRRKEDGAGVPDVSGNVAAGLSGGGQALDAGTRGFMESRFGHDFGSVRIHTDAPASRSAERIAARAYTVGTDIAFRSGEYDPGSGEGRRLLAHELAHVIQRGTARDEVLRAVATNGGTFDTTTYAPSGNGTTVGNRVGANIVLDFTPNDLVVADHIGLTQTVKTLSSSTAGGPVNNPSFVGARNQSLSLNGPGQDTGRAIDQGDPAGASTLPNTNPMYAVDNSPGHVSATLTDVLPPAGGGFGQHGHRKQRPDGTFDVGHATLADGPRRNIQFAGQEWRHSFEATALVLDGPMANTYLGSVAWGWKCDAAGTVTTDPNPITLVRAGAPTSDFMAAAAQWNSATFTDPTTGIAHNTVDLPTTTVDSATVAPGSMTTADLITRLALVNTQATALPGGPGVDRTNKEFERTALQSELARRNAKVDIHVAKKEGRYFNDEVFIKMTGPGGGTTQTPHVNMDDGASHTFLVPLGSVLPLSGPVHVEAWNYNLMSSNDLIVSKDWTPPFGPAAITAGRVRSSYDMNIQFER